MKILLTAVNAKYIHSNLAVYSLRAYAKEYASDIEIAEYTINQTKEEILKNIYMQQPDVLCFSCYIWNISIIEQIAAEFHKLCPKVPIWMGGPEVSYETEAFLNAHPYVTGVIVGEGEKSFAGLCRAYEQGNADEEGLAGQRGLVFCSGKDGRLHRTLPQEALDMSQIPFVYSDMSDFEHKIIYYESSRGCPFCCSYCLSSVDKKLRFRSMDLVRKELAFFIEKEVPQVKFVDRTFNCDSRRAMEIWRFLKEHDKGKTNFHFEIAADLITEEELALLATLRPGLIQLEIGVQTTNPATIEEIHRHMDLAKVKQVVRQIKKGRNIHQHLDLIAGLPLEDYPAFRQSFDEIYELKPDQLQLGFLKVLKGSYMYEHREEYQVIATAYPPYEVLATKWLCYDEVLSIKLVEQMLEIYYNSGQYMRSILLLEESFESAFDMFLALGEYYEKKGYASMNHTRNRRMEILLEFVAEQSGSTAEYSERMREAAVYDIYARENAKSRPAFADDMQEWKQVMREYCKKGKLSHLERFYYELSGERQEEPYYILFDYEQRDLIDHQAKTVRIKEKQE